MRNKFEQLIEYIINEETEKANELFHNIVVEKSREIYNDLVAEEMAEEVDEAEMTMDATDDMMGDIEADEEGMDQEGDDDHDMDDMDMDHDSDHMDMDDRDHEDHGHEDIEDRVVDLEDALDDLKAEFDRLMHDEAGEEDHRDMPEEGVMREYVEKVKDFYKGDNSEGAGVGSGSIGGSTNTKSTVAGKNDMGGTAKNLAQGGEEKGRTAPSAKPMGVNDPKAAGKVAFKSQAPKAVSKEQAGINKDSVFESRKSTKKSPKK